MAPLPTIAAGIALSLFASVDAFSPASTTHRHHVTCSSSSWYKTSSSPITIMSPLQMSDEENTEDTTTAVEDSAEEQPVEEEEEEPKLDPEVVALKEQITSLESDLKAKKTQLNSLKEMADKYSAAGYARQVASLENNKRLRGANMADNKSAARASVLQSFLPVLDELDVIGTKYQGNSFASTLDSGLRSELKTSLNELNVQEYNVEVGDTIDVGRVVVVNEEYSEEHPKGTVIAALKSGLEISGNVVRPVEVVGSLGSESAAAEEGEDGEGGDETGDAEAEE